MPTPSDATAVPAKTYEEMTSAAQAALDEQARAVVECKRNFEELQGRLIPNSGSPPVSGTRER
jgi:hypothetical protein